MFDFACVSWSLDCLFSIAPLVFSNVYLLAVMINTTNYNIYILKSKKLNSWNTKYVLSKTLYIVSINDKKYTSLTL
jgi:hypothetical protein